MKNVYKVSFDLKINGRWIGNENGWDSRFVLANGDARKACDKLEREELRSTYDDVRPSAVRIIKVEQVATNVLV